MKKIRNCILFLSFIIIIFVIYISTTNVIAKIEEQTTIIYLDPGHGGFDGGASSEDDVIVEKDITLKIANYLKNYLEKTNIKVLMTRKKDMALARTKRDDMRKRVSLINNSNCDLYISIHANAYSSKLIKGAQTFYNEENIENKNLANKILGYLRLLDKDNNRKAKSITGKYLLEEVTKTGCLVEIGFLTNIEEVAKLKTDKYLEEIALMMYLGILDFLEEKTYGTINIEN